MRQLENRFKFDGALFADSSFSAAIFKRSVLRGQGRKVSTPHRLFLRMLGVLSASVLGVSTAHAVVKLSPQTVVDYTISRGIEARTAELQAQRSYLALEKAKGVFDFKFNFIPAYEYSESQNLNNQGNPSDKTLTFITGVEKRLPTGTTLSLDYQDIRQTSTLDSFTQTSRAPDANLNAVTFGVRQALLENAFGYADRLAIEIGEAGIQAALESREENLEEIILNSMVLFWNTFIAERELKENMSAREKYEQLVRNVRRKAGFNLSTPGELPRLEAELQATEQKVKASSAKYLNAVDSLKTAIRLESNEAIELDVPTEIPPVPNLKAKPIDELRLMRVAKIGLENARRTRESLSSSTRSKLDLVARARATGVDEDGGRAFAEMTASTYPYYYIGLEFKMGLDSDRERGVVADAEVGVQIAEYDVLSRALSVRDQMLALERQVASDYAIAKSAEETVLLRTRVVRELESSYRQGRQPLVELIRAYNELFNAQLSNAQAIGNYHTRLNRLAAARDELVGNILK